MQVRLQERAASCMTSIWIRTNSSNFLQTKDKIAKMHGSPKLKPPWYDLGKVIMKSPGSCHKAKTSHINEKWKMRKALKLVPLYTGKSVMKGIVSTVKGILLIELQLATKVKWQYIFIICWISLVIRLRASSELSLFSTQYTPLSEIPNPTLLNIRNLSFLRIFV